MLADWLFFFAWWMLLYGAGLIQIQRYRQHGMPFFISGVVTVAFMATVFNYAR
jgi:hypothetical protein